MDVEGLVILGLLLTPVAALVTHIVWLVELLQSGASIAGGQFILAFLGTLIPPIGVVHGFVIWFT